MPKTTYVWDELSDNVIEEYEDGVLAVSYTHEPGLYGNLLSQHRNGVTSYFHYDGRGDTIALTDDSGNITDTNEYDAWGNVIASTGSTVTPYQFGGRHGYQTGATGVYVRARTYQPTVARWCSVDPQWFIDGWNLFLYGASSPIGRVDPSGWANRPAECCGCDYFLDLAKENGFGVNAKAGKIVGRRTGRECRYDIQCKVNCNSDWPAVTRITGPQRSKTIQTCFSCQWGGGAEAWQALIAHEVEHAIDVCDFGAFPPPNLETCKEWEGRACEVECAGAKDVEHCNKCCVYFSCKQHGMPNPYEGKKACKGDGGVPAQPCWKWDKARKRFVRDYSQPGCERTKPPKKPDRPPIEEVDKNVIE